MFLNIVVVLCMFQLIQMGFVSKQNFDDDPDSQFYIGNFDTEVDSNPVLQELKERKQREKVESERAYADWMATKALKEQVPNRIP